MRVMRCVLLGALVLAGCAERPEEVSAQKFRLETDRALRQEAAADLVAHASWKRGAEGAWEVGEWRVVRPSREGALTDGKFYEWLGTYGGGKRLAVVVMGRREVRTQPDLDDIHATIEMVDKAFRGAGFERVAFHQDASFGRPILRE